MLLNQKNVNFVNLKENQEFNIHVFIIIVVKIALIFNILVKFAINKSIILDKQRNSHSDLNNKILFS